MLQKLIDAVNLYRLKHSESEAIGRGVEGLSDAYANLLAVCDVAEQSVHPTLPCTCWKDEDNVVHIDPACRRHPQTRASG